MGPEGRLSRRVLLGFGLGSIGTGIFSMTPGVLLLYFLTDTLSVPPAAAGLAVFLPKAWDVIADPLVGYVSDRTRSRFGRRRPYLLAGAVLMSVTYVFLFAVPVFDEPMESFWYVMALFTLSATAFTVFSIPYVSMPAEMSDDPHERVRILSFRMAFLMLGGVIGSAVAPWLVHAFGGGRGGYALMSVVMGIVCGTSMLCTFVATRHTRLRDAAPLPGGIYRQLRDAWQDSPFRTLMAVYLTQTVGFATLFATMPFFVRAVLGAGEDLVGELFLVMMGAAILSIPVWNTLAARWGKKPCYGVATGLATAAFASPWLPAPALMGIIGIGFGAQQVLPFAMLTDVIRGAAGGSARAGVVTGIWVAGEKLGLALGPLVAGMIFALGGLHRGSAAQTPQVLIAIRVAFSAVPALCMLASLLLLARFGVAVSLPRPAASSDII